MRIKRRQRKRIKVWYYVLLKRAEVVSFAILTAMTQHTMVHIPAVFGKIATVIKINRINDNSMLPIADISHYVCDILGILTHEFV